MTSATRMTNCRVAVLALAAIAIGPQSQTRAVAGQQLTPNSVPVQVRLAEAMAENQDWDEAIREPDRGLSYAEDLYENGIPDYALQEYAKVLCDVYTTKGQGNPHRAYARYRMGVCAYELGRPEAAARQWRRLVVEAPESPWSGQAGRALSVLSADGLGVVSSGTAPALPDDLSSSPVSRLALAEQLLDCGLPLIASKEYLKVIHVVTAGRPNPLQAEATYKLGICHQRLGRLKLAKTAWQQTVGRFPDSPSAEQARSALTRADELGDVLAAPRDPWEVIRR